MKEQSPNHQGISRDQHVFNENKYNRRKYICVCVCICVCVHMHTCARPEPHSYLYFLLLIIVTKSEEPSPTHNASLNAEKLGKPKVGDSYIQSFIKRGFGQMSQKQTLGHQDKQGLLCWPSYFKINSMAIILMVDPCSYCWHYSDAWYLF